MQGNSDPGNAFLADKLNLNDFIERFFRQSLDQSGTCNCPYLFGVLIHRGKTVNSRS